MKCTEVDKLYSHYNITSISEAYMIIYLLIKTSKSQALETHHLWLILGSKKDDKLVWNLEKQIGQLRK